MTKLRHPNPPRESDPARVRQVPEDLSHPERTSRAVDRPSRDELKRRSEEHDRDLDFRNALRRVRRKLAAGEEPSGFDRIVLAEATKRGL